jgi:hypothetical protein
MRVIYYKLYQLRAKTNTRIANSPYNYVHPVNGYVGHHKNSSQKGIA